MKMDLSVHRFACGLLMLAAVLCLFSSPLVAEENGEGRPPNVIVIFMDDMGYGDLSCYGSPVVSTPRIDRMAEEGARLTDFYAVASICSPSRAALLTGSYPQRCGLYMGISPNREEHKSLGLHPNETTIAEMLKPEGYATLAVGKWHLGTPEVFHPMHQGFDEYFGMPHNFLHDPALMDGFEVVREQADLSQITRQYTERTIDFIRRKQDGPFFIFLAHSYPDTPLVPNPDFLEGSRAAKYGAVIEELDWSTGRILDTLAELGLEKDTLVVLTSDNGALPKFVAAYRSAGPLTGSKYTSWEGGQREPCIAYWPGRIPAGQVIGELATTMDLLPTIARLTGARLPDKPIDGRDIWPLLAEGAESPHEVLYFYNGSHLQAVRRGQWKLHLPRTPASVPWWQKSGRPQLLRLEAPVLYDLVNDPAESIDVAGDHPEIVERLLSDAEEARSLFGDGDRRGSAQRPTGDAREMDSAE